MQNNLITKLNKYSWNIENIKIFIKPYNKLIKRTNILEDIINHKNEWLVYILNKKVLNNILKLKKVK